MQFRDLTDILRIPRLTIYLMLDNTIAQEPDYIKCVKEYYDYANSMHPKYFFIKRLELGLSIFKLPATFPEYFEQIEASARRNYKKASRLGYETKKINYNSHLEDIRNIWLSTSVRQSKLLPQHILAGDVRPTNSMTFKHPYYDYVYFGVFKDGQMLAYAACLMIGELCEIQDIYGHDQYLLDGIVPMLIIDIARELYQSYPIVKYYEYGTYFGASASMRRFKRKFLFTPHKVIWKLGLPPVSNLLIYRQDILKPFPAPVLLPNEFFFLKRGVGLAGHFGGWVKNFGIFSAIKIFLKIVSGRRMFFGLKLGQSIIQFGWANIGFCRHYHVEPTSVVLGTLWTDEDQRGKGLAPGAIFHVIHELFNEGFTRFYIDTTMENRASQRMIEKSGFKLLS